MVDDLINLWDHILLYHFHDPISTMLHLPFRVVGISCQSCLSFVSFNLSGYHVAELGTSPWIASARRVWP